MRGIDIPADIYNDILQSKVWKDQGVTVKTEPIKESAEVEAEEVNEAEEQVHQCPLCESQLEEAISEEKIDEHVEFLVSVISEAFAEENDLEDLDEQEDEEVSEEE